MKSAVWMFRWSAVWTLWGEARCISSVLQEYFLCINMYIRTSPINELGPLATCLARLRRGHDERCADVAFPEIAPEESGETYMFVGADFPSVYWLTVDDRHICPVERRRRSFHRHMVVINASIWMGWQGLGFDSVQELDGTLYMSSKI